MAEGRLYYETNKYHCSTLSTKMVHNVTRLLQSLPVMIIYEHLPRSQWFMVRRRTEQCVLYFLNELYVL